MGWNATATIAVATNDNTSVAPMKAPTTTTTTTYTAVMKAARPPYTRVLSMMTSMSYRRYLKIPIAAATGTAPVAMTNGTKNASGRLTNRPGSNRATAGRATKANHLI